MKEERRIVHTSFVGPDDLRKSLRLCCGCCSSELTSQLAVFVMAVSRERGADEVLLAKGWGWRWVLAVKARGIPALT
jgi:hypothetical protein